MNPAIKDDLRNVPDELKQLKRWVTWRYEDRQGKPTKVPFNPLSGKRADSTDPSTWTDFNTAIKHADKYEGVGCVIAPPYVGIDLDKVHDPEGKPTDAQWAMLAIAGLDSYTEYSPSGCGYHIWVKGTLPPGARRAGRVEIYDKGRYFTMTGDRLFGVSGNVEERDVAEFHSLIGDLDPQYFKPRTTPKGDKSKPRNLKTNDLLAGRWKEAGYGSQSEADLALCVLLARKHNCDEAKIDAEFRKSGLFREKWNREDYRDETIRLAIEAVKQNPQKGPKGLHLAMDYYKDIEDKSIVWLWKERIPKGKLTIFSGNPDVGKSVVTCDLVARYTTGEKWPDGAENAATPGDVLILNAEDDANDTIKPRLRAAGADMNRIRRLKGVRISDDSTSGEREIALDTDLALLSKTLEENPEIGLVVIDPITSYLGKADLNKEQEVRRVLIPLKQLCEATGVTLVAVGHFSKRSDVSALHKVGGAVALTGVAWAVFLFAKNPEAEGEYLMLLGKGNLSKKRTGMRYRIEEKILNTGGAPIISWQGDSKESDADQVLETASNPYEKRKAKASRFLEEILAGGEKESEKVFVEGANRGISRNALFEAKKKLGITSTQKERRWYWSLPACSKTEERSNVA